LSPEEAYYWNYSIHPALSYFDHPPLVAWIIYIFTSIFGHTEFAVKVGAVFLSLGLSLFVYKTARSLYSEKIAFYSVLLLNLTFVFNVYSIGITPDSPLFFFWAACVYFFMKTQQEGVEKNKPMLYVLMGFFLGGALLSKYTAVLFIATLIIYLIFKKAKAEEWRMLFTSIIIALSVFSPVIIWNFQNNFASFSFQSTNRFSTYSFSPSQFISSTLMQAVFVTPFFYFALVYALIKVGLNKNKEFNDKFVLWMTAPTLVFFTGISFVTWVKLNWPTPAYITGLILLAAYYVKIYEKLSSPKKNLLTAVIAAAFLIAFTMNLLAYVQPIYPRIFPVLSKGNTMTGWRKLTEKVEQYKSEMPFPGKTFVVGHGYQIASELQFYLKCKEEVFSCNVFDESALAFDFWNQNIKSLCGKDAIIVTGDFIEFDGEGALALSCGQCTSAVLSDPNLKLLPLTLKKYFKDFKEMPPLQVEVAGVKLRQFRIFKCYCFGRLNSN